MIMMKPIEVEGHQVISIEVALPKTTLLAITTVTDISCAGRLIFVC